MDVVCGMALRWMEKDGGDFLFSRFVMVSGTCFDAYHSYTGPKTYSIALISSLDS